MMKRTMKTKRTTARKVNTPRIQSLKKIRIKYLSMKFILTQSASAAKAYREFRAFPASEHSDIPWVTLFNLYQSQVYLYQFFVGNKMFRNFMKKDGDEITRVT